LHHGGDEDAFGIGGSQISAPTGNEKLQLITIQKIVLSPKMALTFLKMTALTSSQEICVANLVTLRHSTFRQLGKAFPLQVYGTQRVLGG
jgi:hypothetical protein